MATFKRLTFYFTNNSITFVVFKIFQEFLTIYSSTLMYAHIAIFFNKCEICVFLNEISIYVS